MFVMGHFRQCRSANIGRLVSWALLIDRPWMYSGKARARGISCIRQLKGRGGNVGLQEMNPFRQLRDVSSPDPGAILHLS